MSQDERRWTVAETRARLLSLREAAELEAAHIKALSGHLDVLASAAEARVSVEAPREAEGDDMGDDIGSNGLVV